MRISSLLGGLRPTVSFEFFPPKTEAGRLALFSVIDQLAPIAPDYVSVTYGAGGGSRLLSFDSCCQIRAHTTGEVMAHLTCVCHTRDEIASISDELWNAGITNIMSLRGDRPKGIDPAEVFGEFPHSQDLMSFLKSRHEFCIGGACYPEGHTETPSIEEGIKHLQLKIDAGCDFLVTQMFFENEHYFRFCDQVRSSGISVPIVPGIMPITGFAQLDKFENQFGVQLPDELRSRVSKNGDNAAEIEQVGIDWAVEQCRGLLQGGAPGIHFYTLNKSSSTVDVCKALKLTGSRSPKSPSLP